MVSRLTRSLQAYNPGTVKPADIVTKAATVRHGLIFRDRGYFIKEYIDGYNCYPNIKESHVNWDFTNIPANATHMPNLPAAPSTSSVKIL